MKLLPAVIVGLLTISVVWAQDPAPGLEAEFIAWDIFRSGSLVARTWKDLHFDGQYFGTQSEERCGLGSTSKSLFRACGRTGRCGVESRSKSDPGYQLTSEQRVP